MAYLSTLKLVMLLTTLLTRVVLNIEESMFTEYRDTAIDSKKQLVKAWIVSQSNSNAGDKPIDSIHRFFDSSPISPSNRYVAYTRMPVPPHVVTKKGSTNVQHEASKVTQLIYAQIIVTDLLSGTHAVIDSTLAWDSQVGAHVQWGSSDDELFYNIVSFQNHDQLNGTYQPFIHTSNTASGGISSNNNNSGSKARVVAVVYNITSHSFKALPCPIYHVSADGQQAVSPNLLKIHYTQMGYDIRGITLPSIPNRNALTNDGICMTSVRDGICKVFVRLQQLLAAAHMDVHHTPVYGFHTKWSSDGKYVMIIVRTLESHVLSISSTMIFKKSTVRVQHLFVVDIHLTFIKRILSWSSSPFVMHACAYNHSRCDPVMLHDGNHPNWIPNTHKISMNLEKVRRQSNGIISSIISRRGTRKRTDWSIVAIDVDLIPLDYQYTYSTVINIISGLYYNHNSTGRTRATKRLDDNHYSTALSISQSLSVQEVYPIGTGHPTFDITGQYILTDAYSKELSYLQTALARTGQQWVRDVTSMLDTAAHLYSPIRLIDIHSQREVWLTFIPIERRRRTSGSGDWSSLHSYLPDAFYGDSNNRDKSWRCDLHITWSRDYRYIAVNARINGGNRQLLVASVGPDLGQYFNNREAK